MGSSKKSVSFVSDKPLNVIVVSGLHAKTGCSAKYMLERLAALSLVCCTQPCSKSKAIMSVYLSKIVRRLVRIMRRE